MSYSNSILLLRLQELTQSARTFRARGSKVIRCNTCLTFIEAALDEYQKLTTQQLSYYRNQEEQL